MLITSLLLAAAALADPLAPARQGQVQCYDPQPAKKLCRAIGSYEFAADGSIVNLGQTRISEEPPIVMFARGPVVVRGGQECAEGGLREEMIERIEVAGQPLDAGTLAVARSQIVASLPDYMRSSGSLCSSYAAKPDGTLSATVDIDGVARPELTATVLWVRPDEDWTVVP